MKAAIQRLGRSRELRTASARSHLLEPSFGCPRPGAYFWFLSEVLHNRYTLEAFRLAKTLGHEGLCSRTSSPPSRARLAPGYWTRA